MSLADALHELEVLLDSVPSVLAGRRADEVVTPSEGWSRAELLGHLIDSALNNLQRIIRLRQVEHLTLPGYDGEAWVTISDYARRPWPELISEWTLLNRHLLIVARGIHATELPRVWISDSGPVTLEFIVVDYVRHLRHHLDQLGVA